MKIYIALETPWEGGTEKVIGYFTSPFPELATPYIRLVEVDVHDSVLSWTQARAEVRKASALAKLTPEELAAPRTNDQAETSATCDVQQPKTL